MALRLVGFKNLQPGQTFRCSICKEAQTRRRVAGSIKYGGRSCCQACFDGPVTLHEYKLDVIDSRPLTEADYQTWAR